jgi:uncharacterized damage-inducible protein DinB
MHDRLQPVVQGFLVGDNLFERALSGVSDEHMRTRIDQRGNSLLWLAGHITTSRYAVARLVGLPDKCPFGELFARGTPLKPDEEYPPIKEIEIAFTELSGKLKERFEELMPEDFDKEIAEGYPIARNDVLHALSFLGFHEAYHIGQMGMVRRLLGYEQLVG